MRTEGLTRAMASGTSARATPIVISRPATGNIHDDINRERNVFTISPVNAEYSFFGQPQDIALYKPAGAAQECLQRRLRNKFKSIDWYF